MSQMLTIEGELGEYEVLEFSTLLIDQGPYSPPVFACYATVIDKDNCIQIIRVASSNTKNTTYKVIKNNEY